MDSFSKIFALLFIISFLSISAATTPESDSDNSVAPQFLGFFRLIPKLVRFVPKVIRGRGRPSIGMPDLPLEPPPAELHNNDLPVAQPPTCPIDTQKIGACMDLIGLKHSAMNECCPILDGLVEAEAAVCMCTTLKEKALDVKVFAPIALQVLANCGKTPPPGYTCSLTL